MLFARLRLSSVTFITNCRYSFVCKKIRSENKTSLVVTSLCCKYVVSKFKYQVNYCNMNWIGTNMRALLKASLGVVCRICSSKGKVTELELFSLMTWLVDGKRPEVEKLINGHIRDNKLIDTMISSHIARILYSECNKH